MAKSDSMGVVRTLATDHPIKTRPVGSFAKHSTTMVYSGSLFVLIFLLGISVAGVLFIGEASIRTAFLDILSPLVDLAAIIILLTAGLRYSNRSRRLRLGWGILGLSMIFYMLGDVVWAVLEIGLKTAPFPSLADGFYSAYYPTALAGVFFLLDKPGRGERLKHAIDISMVMVAATLGFSNFLIGPILRIHPGETALAQDILLAYPVGDLVLLAALSMLVYNLPVKQVKAPVYWLAVALLSMILTDTLYSYGFLTGAYETGGFLDLGWITSGVCFGLAGLAQWKTGRGIRDPEKTIPIYSIAGRYRTSISVLPYILLAGSFVLLILGGMGWMTLSISFLSLSIGVGIIICLALVRQILSIGENYRLNEELHNYVERVQTQAVDLERANLNLERDIEERKIVEEALRESEGHLEEALRMARMGYWEYDAIQDQFTFNDQFYTLFNTTAEQEGGYSMSSRRYLERFVHPQDIDFVSKELRKANITANPEYKAQFEHRIVRANHDVGNLSVLIRIRKSEQGKTVNTHGVSYDITDRVRSDEEIKKRLGELEAVNQVSKSLRQAATLKEMLPILLGTLLEMLHTDDGAIWLFDPVANELQPEYCKRHRTDATTPRPSSNKLAVGINGIAFAYGHPYVVSDYSQEPGLSEIDRKSFPAGMGGAAIPIRAGQGIIGTIEINVALPREFTLDEIRLLTILSEIAGNAIQRISLHQQTERRLHQLMALSNIDRVISSTADIHLSLGMLLEHVSTQLNADATDVLLFNPALQVLDYSIGRGFHTKFFEQARLHLGEGYAGRAALSRETVDVPDLLAVHDNPEFEKYARVEQFVSYYGVPLIARGQVMGVLELFQRSHLNPDKEWLDFLDSLAGQAAIAIDSAMQFENLQRSNSELRQAYDETIEGWSRAMDLRDNETQGHTQRVTEMTVALAREAGFSEADLIQIRWGSLLHDIGKIGVPDNILLKAGPLTEQERSIMKQHPNLAYEMLAPIRYLRSALDIPYCHHERWDGTGYPRGLKGEQIPLAARLFALVDVWDALGSDRPYCSAWPIDKVREHILNRSGSHFDPKYVELFLNSEIVKSKFES